MLLEIKTGTLSIFSIPNIVIIFRNNTCAMVLDSFYHTHIGWFNWGRKPINSVQQAYKRIIEIKSEAECIRDREQMPINDYTGTNCAYVLRETKNYSS